MAHSTLPITNQAETDRSTALSLFVSLRPAQWTKNLFVFAGLIFGDKLTDPRSVGIAFAAFGVFCLLSSTVYLINDLRDREEDGPSPTLHPHYHP